MRLRQFVMLLGSVCDERAKLRSQFWLMELATHTAITTTTTTTVDYNKRNNNKRLLMNFNWPTKCPRHKKGNYIK